MPLPPPRPDRPRVHTAALLVLAAGIPLLVITWFPATLLVPRWLLATALGLCLFATAMAGVAYRQGYRAGAAQAQAPAPLVPGPPLERVIQALRAGDDGYQTVEELHAVLSVHGSPMPALDLQHALQVLDAHGWLRRHTSFLDPYLDEGFRLEGDGIAHAQQRGYPVDAELARQLRAGRQV